MNLREKIKLINGKEEIIFGKFQMESKEKRMLLKFKKIESLRGFHEMLQKGNYFQLSEDQSLLSVIFFNKTKKMRIFEGL